MEPSTEPEVCPVCSNLLPLEYTENFKRTLATISVEEWRGRKGVLILMCNNCEILNDKDTYTCIGKQ